MKNIFFTSLLLFIALIIISAGKTFTSKHAVHGLYKKHDIIGCGTSLADIMPDQNGKFIIVMPGLGHHAYHISTSSDSTQIFFNQGLNFYYSYHFREAIASFKEAARFDSSCAMVYWGQALSMGPYYNSYYYSMKKEVPVVLKKMNYYLSTASEKEQDLIKSMQHRYSNDTSNSDRAKLDSGYSAAMLLLTKKYNKDVDVSALYVDAVMLKHKWDFWSTNGEPRAWTPELIKTCQSILEKDPLHPAALHYYIHLTEASKNPGIALHSADILKDLMPGAGHMVHMATHMYQRNGLFEKGVFVNEDANSVNNKIDSLAPALKIGKNTTLHIYAVQSYCAMNAGMFSQGMPIYFRARNRMLDLRSGIENDLYSQDMYMLPVIAWVRLGKWDEILKAPSPDTKWKYASILDNFAKGLAFIHNENSAAAKNCLNELQKNMNDSLLNVREMPFNKRVQSARIAMGILKGEILYQEGKMKECIDAFTQAVAEEDQLIYSEPQDWRIPARQYLGAYLLKINKPAAAEKVYREDLIASPGNGWSLLGMYNSLVAQNQKDNAIKFKTQYVAAFNAADVMPVSSVY